VAVTPQRGIARARGGAPNLFVAGELRERDATLSWYADCLVPRANSHCHRRSLEVLLPVSLRAAPPLG